MVLKQRLHANWLCSFATNFFWIKINLSNYIKYLLAALHSRPYLARQRALQRRREEPGRVSLQRLWRHWLQAFRRRRCGVHAEENSRLQVYPKPGQQWRGRNPPSVALHHLAATRAANFIHALSGCVLTPGGNLPSHTKNLQNVLELTCINPNRCRVQ